MRPFTLLVKPAGADCNLRCEYCFYLGKCALYPETKKHRMTDAVLEQTIRTYMATPQPVYSFGWQGGEPTLMGADFFRRVTELQQRHGRSGCSVANGLQTNATLITDELARHWAQYHFLLGCSLDGPPELHDRYRRTGSGKPTHETVMRGIEILKRNHVEFNILVLVSQANVRHGREVYRYLTDQGFLYHQYIPCVEFDAAGQPEPFAISGDEWGEFLCAVFDEWYPNDAFRVSVRHFDGIVGKLVDGRSTMCNMERNCCQYFVVEWNGDIYPCDFFVEPQLKIGNVADTTWEAALDSPLYREFGARKEKWDAACGSCAHLGLCFGDCLKHRCYAGRPPENMSWLCFGQKAFLGHTVERFRGLSDEVRERMRHPVGAVSESAGSRPDRGNAPPGRNDPCPCGSGRKFKKCCGRAG